MGKSKTPPASEEIKKLGAGNFWFFFAFSGESIKCGAYPLLLLVLDYKILLF
jgi:hypothetical protein